jgi:hypothetical protein
LFDAIMTAREVQARNMAQAVFEQAELYNLPVYIHGKAYKPDVAYLEGSYSLLVGHYLAEMGRAPTYIDPLTEPANPFSVKGVVLLAHNRRITYGYAGETNTQEFYCEFEPGSVVIDPWRQVPRDSYTDIKVLHYGNTRLV